MNPQNIQKELVHKFLRSGINMTPNTLKLLLKLDNPINKSTDIIKNISFLPDFQSHLTTQILEKIQDKEIQQILKRKTFRDNKGNQKTKDIISTAESKKNEKEFSNSQIKNNISKNPNVQEDEGFEQKDFTLDDLEGGGSDPFLEDFEAIETTGEAAHAESSRELEEGPTHTGNLVDSSQSAKNHSVQEGSKTFKEKNKLNSEKNVIGEGASSSRAFKPIAKDYGSQLDIIKDPTGQLYTSGDYQDFYELYIDKFNKLERLIKKRRDALGANKIKNIYRLSSSVEASVYGLIHSHRRTKNGHYFLTVEDKTGTINVLVRKDSENQLLINCANKLVNDQMVYVKGTYKPSNKRKGIIFADELTTIDISRDFEPHKASDPLSIAYISDSHIGSFEFEEKMWKRFVQFLNGNLGNQNWREIAGRIKYLVINGDLIDGIGVYPHQEDDLVINDLYSQYQKAYDLLSEIPDYIKIIYSSGNHEPVRNAIPRPAVPKKYAEPLLDLDVTLLGNPALINTHGVKTLIYHGDSMIDINQMISGLENNTPVKTMKELLRSRHLAPIYGSKTQIAPTDNDWLVIDEVPDIFHTGHIHINGRGNYHNVYLVNSGCFQAQTEFMKSFGIEPTPGIVPIFELDTLKGYELDFKKNI